MDAWLLAYRGMRRRPLFTAAVAATLSLGIGGNVAAFSVLYQVLLKPLPYPDPDRLCSIEMTTQGGERVPIPQEAFPILAVHTNSFEAVADYKCGLENALSTSDAFSARVCAVTPSFWAVMGVKARLGFATGQPAAGRGLESSATISDRVWNKYYGGNRRVLGTPLRVGQKQFSVTGVMPKSFVFPWDADIWLTASSDLGQLVGRGIVARVRPQLSAVDVGTQLRSLPTEFSRVLAKSDIPRTINITSLQDESTRAYRGTLELFFGASCLVLVLACVNGIVLHLSNSVGRLSEMRTKLALGASRSNLLAQLLMESTTQTVLGALGGTALAAIILKISALQLENKLHLNHGVIHLSTADICFTVISILIIGPSFGLFPALRLIRMSDKELLPSGPRIAMSRRRHHEALAVMQISLATVLLVTAATLAVAAVVLQNVRPGFDTANNLAATLVLPPATSIETMVQLHRRVISSLSVEGLPQVGLINWLPFGNALVEQTAICETDAGEVAVTAIRASINAEYPRVVRMPLLMGRAFRDDDLQVRAPSTILVSNSFARRAWGNANPIGKRITFSDATAQREWSTVIGVVGDVMQQELTRQQQLAVYSPFTKSQSDLFLRQMVYVVPLKGSRADTTSLLQNALRRVSANYAFYSIKSLNELVTDSYSGAQLLTTLLSIYAAIGLGLASLGQYALLALAWSDKKQELAVRMALGASPSVILKEILLRGVACVGGALVLGNVAAWLLDGTIKRLLPDIATPYGLPAAIASLVVFSFAMIIYTYLGSRIAGADPLPVLRTT